MERTPLPPTPGQRPASASARPFPVEGGMPGRSEQVNAHGLSSVATPTGMPLESRQSALLPLAQRPGKRKREDDGKTEVDPDTRGSGPHGAGPADAPSGPAPKRARHGSPGVASTPAIVWPAPKPPLSGFLAQCALLPDELRKLPWSDEERQTWLGQALLLQVETWDGFEAFRDAWVSHVQDLSRHLPASSAALDHLLQQTTAAVAGVPMLTSSNSSISYIARQLESADEHWQREVDFADACLRFLLRACTGDASALPSAPEALAGHPEQLARFSKCLVALADPFHRISFRRRCSPSCANALFKHALQGLPAPVSLSLLHRLFDKGFLATIKVFVDEPGADDSSPEAFWAYLDSERDEVMQSLEWLPVLLRSHRADALDIAHTALTNFLLLRDIEDEEDPSAGLAIVDPVKLWDLFNIAAAVTRGRQVPDLAQRLAGQAQQGRFLAVMLRRYEEDTGQGWLDRPAPSVASLVARFAAGLPDQPVEERAAFYAGLFHALDAIRARDPDSGLFQLLAGDEGELSAVVQPFLGEDAAAIRLGRRLAIDPLAPAPERDPAWPAATWRALSCAILGLPDHRAARHLDRLLAPQARAALGAQPDWAAIAALLGTAGPLVGPKQLQRLRQKALEYPETKAGDGSKAEVVEAAGLRPGAGSQLAPEAPAVRAVEAAYDALPRIFGLPMGPSWRADLRRAARLEEASAEARRALEQLVALTKDLGESTGYLKEVVYKLDTASDARFPRQRHEYDAPAKARDARLPAKVFDLRPWALCPRLAWQHRDAIEQGLDFIARERTAVAQASTAGVLSAAAGAVLREALDDAGHALAQARELAEVGAPAVREGEADVKSTPAGVPYGADSPDSPLPAPSTDNLVSPTRQSSSSSSSSSSSQSSQSSQSSPPPALASSTSRR